MSEASEENGLCIMMLSQANAGYRQRHSPAMHASMHVSMHVSMRVLMHVSMHCHTVGPTSTGPVEPTKYRSKTVFRATYPEHAHILFDCHFHQAIVCYGPSCCDSTP